MSNEKKTTGKPLSGALKTFYGVGDFGFTLMSNVESYYFNFFLTNLAKFGLGTVSMITTVASLVDACLSWMYGAILNSIKPKKWGRYRSWLVLIPWIVPFLYAFQFIKVGDGAISAIIIVIAAISSHVCWNFAYVANVSMISVAGKTPEDRAQLASTRAFWANLSKVVFSYVGAPLAAVFAGIIGETNQYGAAAFVLGVIMAFLYFCHFKMFDGYEEVEVTTEAKKEDKTKTGAGDLVKSLLQNPPLLALLLCDLAKFMFNFVCMGAAIYYFTYVANNAGWMPRYILISNILCVIAAYCFKYFAKAISARTTAIITFAAMAVACFIAYMNYENMMFVVVFMSIAQFGYGIAYAATPALYADTIVYAEWKTGKNAAGWISGLQNVPLKVAILTRGIIISAGLAMGNFSADIDPAAASAELKQGVCMAFIVIPAIALVIAAVVMLFGFRLTKDKVVQYQSEIAARKA
ncbi:MAG: MFS transporter [Lachnospiraceae bacterium]|nr:MFS transporter [Lachnospiraceae bacterium]